MAKRFHHKTGTMVTLTNGEKTACRNNPYQEFNNGLVMSSEPLLDDQIFEVRIDKQVRYLLIIFEAFFSSLLCFCYLLSIFVLYLVLLSGSNYFSK